MQGLTRTAHLVKPRTAQKWERVGHGGVIAVGLGSQIWSPGQGELRGCGGMCAGATDAAVQELSAPISSSAVAPSFLCLDRCATSVNVWDEACGTFIF